MRKWKRILTWLLLSLVTAVIAIACADPSVTIDESRSDNAKNCRVVEHDLGQAEICGDPQKIVVLSVNALDLLLSLNEQPSGFATRFNVYRGEVFDNPDRQIPYLGDRVTTQPANLGQSDAPSLEKMASIDPDLILGEAGQNANNYDLLSQIAPTILWKARTTEGQWQENLRDIAKAIGEEEKAQIAIDRYQNLVAEARSDFAEVASKHPQILLLGTDRIEENIHAISPNSYLGNLLTDIGFEVIPKPSDNIQPSLPVSVETLPKLDDADIIIVLSYNSDFGGGDIEELERSSDKTMTDLIENHQLQTIEQNWKENAIAQSLTASKENRVFFATYAKWNGLNGPIGAELVLEQLREFLLQSS